MKTPYQQPLKIIILSWLYSRVIKPIFFLFDEEKVHNFMMSFGTFLGKSKIAKKILSKFLVFHDKTLEQNIGGINFKNPIGLAAGFDKNGVLVNLLESIGFGFAEIGSITAQACTGNPGKRLWRLKKLKSLVVNLGLNGQGVDRVLENIKNKKSSLPIGLSLAATNCQANAETQEAIKDFKISYEKIMTTQLGDYLTINLSCPNAFGGESFLKPQRLEKLMFALFGERTKTQENNNNNNNFKKPIFLKLSAQIDEDDLRGIIKIAEDYNLTGFICSNLLKNREGLKNSSSAIPEVGGLSGKPLAKLSTELIARVYKLTGKKFIIIGCGGIFSGQDAYEKIRAGASLLQMITGMIYQGPQVVSQINRELAYLIKKDGYKSVSEAIGVDSN